MSDEDSITTIIVNFWMDAVRPTLNESKTEHLYFGNHQKLAKCQHSSLIIIGDTIDRRCNLKYTSSVFDVLSLSLTASI